jgi:catechol 2,3-dioxygenase-like lactoylglutathione lyase family enzyme/general stress protein 26
MVTEPVAELDARFSSPGASPVEWVQARQRLADAEVYWLSTVRPDGRPHVTPLLSVWLDSAWYFCTGPSERKAENLARNPHCALITGCNALNEGLDLVVEGHAARVTDDTTLRRISEAYESKYGRDRRFTVRDGVFVHEPSSPGDTDPGQALVYAIAPATAFGFGKGEFSQTRWRFPRDEHREDSEPTSSSSRPSRHPGMLRAGDVATRLPAQDLARARSFYAEKLGLEPVEARPGGLRYRCGSGQFSLFESTGAASGSHTQMAWEVDDIVAVVEELRRRGVVFEQIDVPGLCTVDGIADVEGNYPSAGGVGERAAWFRDSEGNLLGIGQPVR